ncbi:MAG TPA: 30S ribosomal protein S9 [Candidatus Binatia bacterium]|jgi:small subunit ribosomal protein S9|nr:30S ribosomal protein S9 [Candidatus Binatia bacterium]
MSAVQFYATGRRKTATARVYLRHGAGKLVVNRRPIDVYFHTDALKRVVREPLALTETAEKFDVLVNVAGGGEAGQAGAIRHGIARALVVFEPTLRGKLKEAGFLTRDSRVKERKKYGQKGARARFQYSKR